MGPSLEPCTEVQHNRLGRPLRHLSDGPRPGPGAISRCVRSLATVVSVVTLMLASCLLCTQARADEGRTVRLTDAIQRAAEVGPGVSVASAGAGALAASRDAASTKLPAPPTVSVAAGPRVASSTTFDLQVGVYVPFSMRDVSGARTRSVDATRRFLREDLDRAKSDAGLRAALAWTRALEAHQILAVREATLERADELVALASRRVTSGVARPSELAMAAGDRAFAAAAVLDAEGSEVDALVELRVAIGAAPGARLKVEGDLATEVPAARARARAFAAENLAQSPTLRSTNAFASTARADVALAHSSSGPNLSVGAMFAREGDGSTIVLGSVSVPLPFVDAAAFDRSRAEAAARTAEADSQRVKVELEARLSLAAHDMEHTREVRERLTKDAVPMLREALRLSLAEVTAGTSDVGPGLTARQRLLAAEEAVAHSQGEVLRADLRFLHVTGKLLSETQAK